MPAQVLTCHLLHEVSKGRRSYWHSYLSKLPKEYTTLAYFTAEEAQELQEAFSIAVAQSAREAVSSDHEAALPLLSALGARYCCMHIVAQASPPLTAHMMP